MTKEKRLETEREEKETKGRREGRCGRGEEGHSSKRGAGGGDLGSEGGAKLKHGRMNGFDSI